MLGAMLSLLGGCSQVPDRINPVEWWHGLQGGAIAEQRPPPPGADQAYPNLASVPAKPASPDLKMHQQIADNLAAARAQAQYAAAQAPLANASPPAPPSPGGAVPAGGSAPPPAPSSDVAGASLAAATAPPAPPVAPPVLPPLPAAPSAGVPGGASASAGRTAAGQAPAALAPPPEADVPGPVAADPNPPGFALEPPPPPSITGAPMAAAAIGSAAPPVMPKPPAGSAGPKQVGATVPIAFERGSAVLPSVSRDALRSLAHKRQNAIVWVTGFGEAAAVGPAAQSAALTLAFARAQVMAAALTHAGVPGYFIRVAAEASGRGGAARLVE